MEAFTNKPETGADFAATDGDYLAEINARLLTISRPSDGHMIVFYGRQAVDDFKSACRSHGAARAISTYLKIAPYQADDKGRWFEGCYKDGATVSRLIDGLLGVAS